MPEHRPARDMRGFASMNEDLQRKISSKGGVSVPAQKRGFYKDRKLAKEAGSKGGGNVPNEKRAFARDLSLASAAARLGAQKRRAARAKTDSGEQLPSVRSV